MFISKKKYQALNDKIKALGNRVAELETGATVQSFYFGNVTFKDYVRKTEKTISRLSREGKGG